MLLRNLPKEELIMFDLDGTLAESKGSVTEAMSQTLSSLLEHKKVAIISGGAWPQFERQVISHLAKTTHVENLFLMPTSGTRLDVWRDTAWHEEYAENFSQEEKFRIINALKNAVKTLPDPERIYGEVIEDRGSQITFSALGQEAPIEEKELWDPDQTKRRKILETLVPDLPEYEVRMGGTTSIDITKKGEDKAYGIKKIARHLSVPLSEILYVGDALYAGGNDYPAKELGVHCIQVKDENETLELIKGWLQE